MADPNNPPANAITGTSTDGPAPNNTPNTGVGSSGGGAEHGSITMTDNHDDTYTITPA